MSLPPKGWLCQNSLAETLAACPPSFVAGAQTFHLRRSMNDGQILLRCLTLHDCAEEPVSSMNVRHEFDEVT